jgi:tetratricopeptide (TPR) repeat protein
MMRTVWKTFIPLGFITLLFFSGCGEREVPIEERVSQAESLLDAGQIDGAILILERCLEREPDRVDVLEPLAFAYSGKGDPVMAALTFKRIAELVPSQPEYLLYAAESLVESDDSKGAVACYDEYLSKRPEDRAVWVTLAQLQASSGRQSEALEAWLAAEQVESRSSHQIAIGELYMRLGNLAQAQAWFARALDGDSESRDEALLGLLETAVRAKRFAEAEALLIQIDAEYPGRVDQSPLDSVRDQLAEWHHRREAAREAMAALEARRIKEEAAARQAALEAERAAAEATEDAQVPEEPVKEPGTEDEQQVAEVVAEEPLPPAEDDHLELARRSSLGGDLPAAVRHYKQALVQDDSRPEVWAELSEVYLRAGKDSWARATASEAVRRNPDNPKFILQYLRAAQRTMEIDLVIREMEDAYRRFPEQPEIILVLARAYSDQGNLRNARLLLIKFLDLVPVDHPQRTSAEMELQGLGG